MPNRVPLSGQGSRAVPFQPLPSKAPISSAKGQVAGALSNALDRANQARRRTNFNDERNEARRAAEESASHRIELSDTNNSLMQDLKDFQVGDINRDNKEEILDSVAKRFDDQFRAGDSDQLTARSRSGRAERFQSQKNRVLRTYESRLNELDVKGQEQTIALTGGRLLNDIDSLESMGDTSEVIRGLIAESDLPDEVKEFRTFEADRTAKNALIEHLTVTSQTDLLMKHAEDGVFEGVDAKHLAMIQAPRDEKVALADRAISEFEDLQFSDISQDKFREVRDFTLEELHEPGQFESLLKQFKNELVASHNEANKKRSPREVEKAEIKIGLKIEAFRIKLTQEMESRGVLLSTGDYSLKLNDIVRNAGGTGDGGVAAYAAIDDRESEEDIQPSRAKILKDNARAMVDEEVFNSAMLENPDKALEDFEAGKYPMKNVGSARRLEIRDREKRRLEVRRGKQINDLIARSSPSRLVGLGSEELSSEYESMISGLDKATALAGSLGEGGENRVNQVAQSKAQLVTAYAQHRIASQDVELGVVPFDPARQQRYFAKQSQMPEFKEKWTEGDFDSRLSYIQTQATSGSMNPIIVSDLERMLNTPGDDGLRIQAIRLIAGVTRMREDLLYTRITPGTEQDRFVKGLVAMNKALSDSVGEDSSVIERAAVMAEKGSNPLAVLDFYDKQRGSAPSQDFKDAAAVIGGRKEDIDKELAKFTMTDLAKVKARRLFKDNAIALLSTGRVRSVDAAFKSSRLLLQSQLHQNSQGEMDINIAPSHVLESVFIDHPHLKGKDITVRSAVTSNGDDGVFVVLNANGTTVKSIPNEGVYKYTGDKISRTKQGFRQAAREQRELGDIHLSRATSIRHEVSRGSYTKDQLKGFYKEYTGLVGEMKKINTKTNEVHKIGEEQKYNFAGIFDPFSGFSRFRKKDLGKIKGTRSFESWLSDMKAGKW